MTQHSACTRVCGRNTPTSRDARCLATRDIRLARPPGAGLPVPRPRRSVHAGAVGPRLRGRGPLHQALQAPRESPAGHDPHLRGLPVAHRAGRDAGGPGADRHPGPPTGRPAGKIRCIPGAWHRAGAAKQLCCGSLSANDAMRDSRKIYICALQTAPQWAIIDTKSHGNEQASCGTWLEKEVLTFMFELDIEMLKEQGLRSVSLPKRPHRTWPTRARTSWTC